MRTVNTYGYDLPPETQPPTVGFQATVDFAPGIPASETQALDIMAPHGLGVWRVSAVTSGGPGVLGRLIYGTSSSFSVDNLILPLVAHVPGNCALYLRPTASPPASPLSVRVSAVLVGGCSSEQHLRSFHDAALGALTLPASVVRYTALSASVVTVEGVAVALAPAQSLRTTAPAVLTSGQGIAEHEL